MNDRQYDPYAGTDPYAGEYAGEYAADQYQVVGYDEYGRPVYQQVQQAQQVQQVQQPQVPQQSQQPQGYGYDPYAGGQQGYDGYGGAGTSYDTGHSPYGAATPQDTAWIPQQQTQPEPPAPEPAPTPPPRREQPGEYRTEQFSFIEEPDEESEDVIDWLKFTESRTERREEAKRRGRSRVVALVVVLALVIAGGVGYLWFAGKLPGRSGDDGGAAAASGPQKRDVIVLHLHDTKGGGTSTALLVNNATTERGATVLLPNTLAVSDDDGTPTTLGKSVDDDGSTGTRDAIDTVLGTQVEGTWRLDTPYLENLVELVGNIDIDTNTDVPDPKAKKGEAPLVKKGEQQTLSGKMAVAYATYRASGEQEADQLQRFGAVMQGVLRKLSSDPQAATTTVQSLAQILDPSLEDKDLGAFLAKLADRAKGGDYKTTLLPVGQGGTLTDGAGEAVVKDVLGGAVTSPEKDAAVRVGVRNATGKKNATQDARVSLVNGGYTFIDGGAGPAARPASQVTYADADKKEQATEVAKTLGLPESAVRKGTTAANADVSVVLGQDYRTR
ncbi:MULTISPECIES: LCP family protein [unclassified Streptomyces]|uniref:LytR C-terminal domain-containing protein n=1 Tax=unclassified Streptomyces TaxID=2593676 RepID=UPI0013699A72|nr:LytR family transcriptional regulator [Streptomyces sp. SID335]MYZ15342.1 LytR family transcriptional regulator [Streptomyces sp. SID337]NDZ86269.1 LCP family protein [Streptomyces sp. SID10115]NEA04703.1 LCP family protein [Streptomyces sp. SID10116]NEB48572.1 LCP family protein [Streptomyces sp. SID339]